MLKLLCIMLLRTTFTMLLICNLSLANTRIAVLGDRTGGADQGVFDGIIDEINLLHPDMLINIGDLIEGPQPNEAAIHKQWDIVMNSMSRLKCPVYYVPGNNDIFNEESRRIYTERTGTKPEYSFDFNELHFVVIDNSEMRRWKTMTPERMQWLESDLSGAVDAVLTIVVFHKPFWISNFSKERRDMMHELFVKYGVDWVFSGHHHRYTATTRDDINYVMVGSSGGHIGNNKYRGELYHFGWMTEDSGSSQFAMLDAGHIRSKNWLTLEDRLIQDDLEGCLLTISRPTLTSGTSKCAIQLSFRDDCNVSGGDFVWDLNDTNWVISPSTGFFNVGAGKTVIDCSAMIKGSRYPLPKLTIHTEIKGREYEIYNFLAPVIRADLGRETSELIIDGQITELGWRGDSVAILDDFGGDYGGIIPTDPIEIRVIQERDRLCFGISAIVSEPMDEMPETKPDRDSPVFMKDCVYLMIWSEETPSRITQIIINSDGGILDQQGFAKDYQPEMDKEWNGDILYKVARSEKKWTAEISIPLSDLGILIDGKRVLFNALRYQPSMEAVAMWQTLVTYDPESAGELIFKQGQVTNIFNGL